MALCVGVVEITKDVIWVVSKPHLYEGRAGLKSTVKSERLGWEEEEMMAELCNRGTMPLGSKAAKVEVPGCPVCRAPPPHNTYRKNRSLLLGKRSVHRLLWDSSPWSWLWVGSAWNLLSLLWPALVAKWEAVLPAWSLGFSECMESFHYFTHLWLSPSSSVNELSSLAFLESLVLCSSWCLCYLQLSLAPVERHWPHSFIAASEYCSPGGPGNMWKTRFVYTPPSLLPMQLVQ